MSEISEIIQVEPKKKSIFLWKRRFPSPSHFPMLAQKKKRAKTGHSKFVGQNWPKNFKGILSFFGILRFFMTSKKKGPTKANMANIGITYPFNLRENLRIPNKFNPLSS